jgi:hypothetical protein
MRKISQFLFFIIILLSFANQANAQARVQFIHNSPDLLLDSIDIYINKTKVLNDFKFRTASGFMDAFTGVNLVIDICDPTTTTPSNALATFTTQFVANNKYIIVTSGELSPLGYNPYRPFSLQSYNLARENAITSTNTDLMYFHGSPDSPTVDLWLNGTGILSEDLAFNSFDEYSEIPTADYVLELKDSTSLTIINSYDLKLAEWGMNGLSGILLTSGFVNPSSNNFGSPFGIFIAPSTGGAFVEVPPVHVPTAYLQVIHNSADLSLSVVDIWVNDKIVANDLTFRNAISFIELDGDASATVAILPSNSTSPANPLASLTATFADGVSYVLTTAGIKSSSGYNPMKPFEIKKFDNVRQQASITNNTDILFFHGTTDLESVNITETGAGIGSIATNLSYSNYQGYKNLLTADYIFTVKNIAGDVSYGDYIAPLSQLGMAGKAITIVCSGFLNPETNSNGEKFGLYVARATGGSLIPLLPYTPPTTSDIQFIHNSADTALSVVDVWVDDQLIIDNLEFGKASPFHEVLSGSAVKVSIATSNSTSSLNPIISQEVNIQPGKKNMLVIHGIQSATGYEPKKDLALELKTNIRTLALNPLNTDVNIFHGCTDAPEIDVYEFTSGALLQDIGFGSFSDYAERVTANGGIHIYDPQAQIIESYTTPLLTMGFAGKALTMITSGFINPIVNSNGPAFGVYIIPLNGGNLIPLQKVTGIENPNSLVASIYPNPASQFLYIKSALNEKTKVDIQLMTIDGSIVRKTQSQGSEIIQIAIDQLPSGIYLLKLISEGRVSTNKVVIQ